jgi:Flp pilus assembly protein TadG
MRSRTRVAVFGRDRRGNAMIEFCFMLPWYVFLFVGTFDFGFYAYSLIATTSAAREAAAYCSASSSTCNTDPQKTSVCTNLVITQLNYMPNMGSAVTTCSASPLTLTITYPSAASCPDGNACATASVVYVTPQLFPIPSQLAGQLTVTKTITMRLAS